LLVRSPTSTVFSPLSLHDALPISCSHELMRGFFTPISAVVLAKARTHNHRAVLWSGLRPQGRTAIRIGGDGSRPSPGRRCGWFSDRKSTRLNSSHVKISYAVFCLE